MTAVLPPEVAGSLLQVAYSVTREDAKRHVLEAMRRGLPLQTAAEVLDRWDRENAPQVIGADR